MLFIKLSGGQKSSYPNHGGKPFRIGLWSPQLGCTFVLVTVGGSPVDDCGHFFAARPWRKEFWGIVGRAHYWAVVSGCLGFVVFVMHWELW